MTQPGGRPVVVVGLMASGKTSVAARLAAALRRRFHDSDQDLERRYGQTAAEQAGRYGADVLHRREATVLREALAERPAPVIAAAASVIDDPECREALAGPETFVVWLDAPPEVLAGRIDSPDNHRPRYHPDAETMLAEQRGRRAPLFAAVADLTVDVSQTTPEQATALIVDSLART